MANQEMNDIKALDDSKTSVGQLLREHSDKMWFYYAEKDDWVGNEKETVLGILKGVHEGHHVRVVHGQEGIPHSFCVSEYSVSENVSNSLADHLSAHSEVVAEQCAKWLEACLSSS